MGHKHKFALELEYYLHEYKLNSNQFFVGLKAAKPDVISGRTTWLNLPLKALPWLCEQMAKMLVEYDGAETRLLKAPAKIPEKRTTKKTTNQDMDFLLYLFRTCTSNCSNSRDNFCNFKFFSLYSQLAFFLQSYCTLLDATHS